MRPYAHPKFYDMPRIPIALLVSYLLSGCIGSNVPPDQSDVPIVPETAERLTITVERAYTLEDPRDLDFKARIAAEAASACGSAGHRIMSTRPYGPEQIGVDYLYRMYEVGIACTG